MQLALENNDVAAAKQYLLRGAGPELARSDGDTHLHKAVEIGDFELVKLLIHAGADCSVQYQGQSMSNLAQIKVKTCLADESVLYRCSQAADPNVVTQ